MLMIRIVSETRVISLTVEHVKISSEWTPRKVTKLINFEIIFLHSLYSRLNYFPCNIRYWKYLLHHLRIHILWNNLHNSIIDKVVAIRLILLNEMYSTVVYWRLGKWVSHLSTQLRLPIASYNRDSTAGKFSYLIPVESLILILPDC